MKIRLCFCWFALLFISQAAEKVDDSHLQERAKFVSLKHRTLDPATSLKKIFLQLHQHKRITQEEFDRRCANPNALDFTDLDFIDCDLSYLTIINADFSRAKLRRASFYGSVLERIKFCQADCSKSDNRKMTLTVGDYTGATLNGARFEGSTLIDIIHAGIRASKGCLFEDSKTLTSKLTRDKELKEQVQSLSGSPQSICLIGTLTSESIYQTVYEGLVCCQKRNQRFTLVDFRKLVSINKHTDFPKEPISFMALYSLVQDYLELFRTPCFKEVVVCAYDHIDELLILVELNIHEASMQEHQKMTHFNRPKLDLHGKIPLQIKRKWVDQFIKKSHAHGYPTIEIITGTGLHNPSGILGQQWNIIRDILRNNKYRPYIQDIHTLGKNGGWRVDLKDSRIKTKFRNGDSIKHKALKPTKSKNYFRFKNHAKTRFLITESQREHKYRFLNPPKPTPQTEVVAKAKAPPQKAKAKPSTPTASASPISFSIPGTSATPWLKTPQPAASLTSQNKMSKRALKKAKNKEVAVKSSSVKPVAPGVSKSPSHSGATPASKKKTPIGKSSKK